MTKIIEVSFYKITFIKTFFMAGILFPTDFSDASMNALDFAIQIAKRNNMRIVLFHAYQIHVMDPNMPLPEISIEAIQESAMKQLETLKSDLLQKENLHIETAAGFGFTSDAINQATEDFDIDYVVMGTTGASGITRTIMGSNTASCIDKIKIPVIAIPLNSQFRGFDKIIFASALHEEELPALEKLNDLLKHFGAEVHVVHTFNQDDKQRLELNKFQELADAKLYNVKTFYRQFGGSIVDGIEQAIRLQKTDALVMVTHHRGFFKKLFDRSITKQMIYHTDVPLIAFHA